MANPPQQDPLSLTVLPGPEAARHLDALAQLRIAVFREWPYLYDGALDYERAYLDAYFRCENACVAIALAGEQLVGASTALPLSEAEAAFRAPFEATGESIGDVFYFGESILLPNFRGRGTGARFMEAREVHARALDFLRAAFCGVQRPVNHPLRPKNERPLDAFWQRCGFQPRPDLVCHVPWKDIDQPGETEKPLQFWLKELTD
ncbi:MAG: GNAT family N-acetyltransferase [Opitutales bacterium]